jgi:hypothetical protein
LPRIIADYENHNIEILRILVDISGVPLCLATLVYDATNVNEKEVTRRRLSWSLPAEVFCSGLGIDFRQSRCPLPGHRVQFRFTGLQVVFGALLLGSHHRA